MSASLVPGSSLAPSSSLDPHWGGPNSHFFPTEDFYPDDAQRPSDGGIFGFGVPSAESFGAPDGAPDPARWPRTAQFPTADLSGARVFTAPDFLISTVGVASSEAFDRMWLDETVYELNPDAGPVGPPRHGLRPSLGKQPGSIDGAPISETQFLYRRIHFPKTTVYPGRGLYTERVDSTPKQRLGWTVTAGHGTWKVRKNARFRAATASFNSPIGHFNAHGVFSSDLSGRIPYVVELSDGKSMSDLAGGVEPVELALLNASVEMDDPAFGVELEAFDEVEVEVA